MKAPELFILHGWAPDLDNQKKWQLLLDELATGGLKPTFLHIPGLDTHLDSAWTLERYENWLASVLPDKPVALLGHSFGGQLAIRFAANHPNRVSQLILIGPAGIKDLSLKMKVKRAVFFVVAKLGKRVISHRLAEKVLYKLAREHDYEKASNVMKETMRNVISEEIVEDIPRITSPVTLIWGLKIVRLPMKILKNLSEPYPVQQSAPSKMLVTLRNLPIPPQRQTLY